MKYATLLLIALAFGITSCTSEKKEANTDATKDHPQKVEVDDKGSNDPAAGTFIVDDYPISEKMLEDKGGETKGGKLSSHGQAWFTNKKTNQTIVIKLATDYHRLMTYHFDNSNLPDEIIDRMELHDGKGGMASSDLKKKHFNEFLEKSAELETKYFTTDKGVSLGDNKEKLMAIYGKPDKTSTKSGLEVLEWSFVGDELAGEQTGKTEKQLAKDSFGHKVTMFFKDGNLVGQMLFNDVP